MMIRRKGRKGRKRKMKMRRLRGLVGKGEKFRWFSGRGVYYSVCVCLPVGRD